MHRRLLRTGIAARINGPLNCLLGPVAIDICTIKSSLLHICSHKKLHNKRVSTLAIVAIKLYHLNKIEGQ